MRMWDPELRLRGLPWGGKRNRRKGTQMCDVMLQGADREPREARVILNLPGTCQARPRRKARQP